MKICDFCDNETPWIIECKICEGRYCWKSCWKSQVDHAKKFDGSSTQVHCPKGLCKRVSEGDVKFLHTGAKKAFMKLLPSFFDNKETGSVPVAAQQAQAATRARANRAAARVVSSDEDEIITVTADRMALLQRIAV